MCFIRYSFECGHDIVAANTPCTSPGAGDEICLEIKERMQAKDILPSNGPLDPVSCPHCYSPDGGTRIKAAIRDLGIPKDVMAFSNGAHSLFQDEYDEDATVWTNLEWETYIAFEVAKLRNRA